MIGVTLKNKALMDVVEGCVDHGVLVLTANGSCASCRRSTSPGMN